MSKQYTSQDISILKGLEAVRTRPGMYIGGTGTRGLHHILWEIADNSIDEVANGFGDRVDIEIFADGSAEVRDNGRGIPVDIHPEEGVPGVVVVFTQLHAGGKFNNDTYQFSGGLHGVGASVTNALSEWLTVTVKKDGKAYVQDFHSPELDGKIISGTPKGDMKTVPAKPGESGTTVRFKPDERVFPKKRFDFDTIKKRLRELAFLNGGITLTVKDHRQTDDETGEPVYAEFCYRGGLSDFVAYMNEDKEVLYPKPIFLSKTESNFAFSVGMQHTESYTENIFSYVNNIPTTEGGTHETGFKTAYTKVMNDFARDNGYLSGTKKADTKGKKGKANAKANAKAGGKPEKQLSLLGEDFRQGLTVILLVKMQNVQFEGQTKTKLGNPEARTQVETIFTELMVEHLKRMPKRDIDAVMEKAIAAMREREAINDAKNKSRLVKDVRQSSLIGKLTPCTGKDAKVNEIFIVEGNSAGGTAKKGRDSKTQAILPLRGKPLNAEKKRVEQVLQNEEIATIIGALGCGFDYDFRPENLKYHKIIIMADADQDGAHIRAILLTFFFRYMKELLMRGHVYIGMPPLYKVKTKDKQEYVYDDDELQDAIARIGGRGYKLQRYKGLGEMNGDQLWETTMNPATRQLMKVSVEDAAYAEKIISVLMGDNVEARKRFIYEHANFNKEDGFERYV